MGQACHRHVPRYKVVHKCIDVILFVILFKEHPVINTRKKLVIEERGCPSYGAYLIVKIVSMLQDMQTKELVIKTYNVRTISMCVRKRDYKLTSHISKLMIGCERKKRRRRWLVQLTIRKSNMRDHRDWHTMSPHTIGVTAFCVLTTSSRRSSLFTANKLHRKKRGNGW